MRRLSSFTLLGLAAVTFNPTISPAWADALPAQTAANHAFPPSTHLPGTPAARALEPAAPLALASAIELALSANPDLAAAARELQAVEGAVMQAGVRPNPDFSALVEDTRQATRTTTFQINQPIELGGKRAARIESAERGRNVASAELAAKRLEIRAAVVAAFFGALVAQERVQLAEALLDLARQATLAASRRVSAGKVSPVEETRARVAEASVRVELHQARSELAVARQRLAATWGNPVPRFTRADGRSDALPPLQPPEEIQARLTASPAFARARFEVDRRAALAEVERTRRTPDVTVSLGTRRDEALGRNQAIVGLSVPLPLFDRNQGNLLEALRRTDKARDELAATEIRLSAEVAQAWARLQAASLEVDALQKDILPGAQSAYEAVTRGYELGKFGFLDVLDAQRTLFQARSRHLQALAEAHRARAELDRILGADDDAAIPAPH